MSRYEPTQRNYLPTEKSLVELFEKQVHTSQQENFVHFKEQKVGYKTLNNHANQLAYFIKEHQHKTSHRIIIHMEYSIDAVICMLAALKSNNTYIPIDVGTPHARILEIIDDAQANVILTDQPVSQDLMIKATVINLNDWKREIAKKPIRNLIFDTYNPIAYILYTSGTTGKPKGVQVTHHALINLLQDIKDRIHFQVTWVYYLSLVESF